MIAIDITSQFGSGLIINSNLKLYIKLSVITEKYFVATYLSDRKTQSNKQ